MTVTGKDFELPTAEQIAMLAKAQLPEMKTAVLGMSDVRTGMSDGWFVCRAPQNPSAARLLDVAVSLRGAERVPCLAVLQAPNEKAPGCDTTYLRAYQSIVWHAFGVAFVLEGDLTFGAKDAAPSKSERDDFDALVAELHVALERDAATAKEGAQWMLPEDSREAEAMVRWTINRVLRPKGYRRQVDGGNVGKHYNGFWRGAEADGLWSNANAMVKSIALESKLDEDAKWPLCQAVDHLAHVSSQGGGGVVYVRVHRPERKPADHTPEMRQLADTSLVKYLDIELT